MKTVYLRALISLTAILSIAPIAQAGLSGIETLGGIFEIYGSYYFPGDYYDDPGLDDWPAVSLGFYRADNQPVYGSDVYVWPWGLMQGVFAEASYERVAAINMSGYWYPDYSFAYASSDYLFRPLGSGTYEIAFSGSLGFRFVQDALEVYLADTTTDEILLNVYNNPIGDPPWTELFSWGNYHTETLLFDLVDTDIYRLKLFVQPDSCNNGEAWFGDIRISMRPISAPVPAPGALSLVLVGLAFVRSRRCGKTT